MSVFFLLHGTRDGQTQLLDRPHDERGVGWIAGSENKAHGKVASHFAQPYISPPDYNAVEFPSKSGILLVQQSAVDEYERFQQSNATARQEVPPQQVDAGSMRMMNSALWILERVVEP
jgi:hypothetical protein